MLLLRVGMYKSLWEEPNPISDIVEKEFCDENAQPDLRLSIYEVESTEVIRCFAEHTAAAKLKPPNGRTHVDMSGAPAELHQDPLEGPFALVRTAHCELVFQDSGSLTAFLALVRTEFGQRGRRTTGAEVKSYVRARIAANDPEWVTFVAANPSWDL